MTKKNQDNSFNFRFQIGNDRQSKRLVASLGRILLFHFLFFVAENRNTGFSSRHLLRLQIFCMNSRFTRLVIGTSRTVGSAKKFVRITSGFGGGGVPEVASQGMYMSKIEICFFTARILQNQRMLCCGECFHD